MDPSSVPAPYTSSDRLRDLVDDDNLLLLVIDRFRIPLGFGDSVISEICAAHGLDCDTFLAVANIISHRPYEGLEVSLVPLMDYLETAHSYFLDFILPAIREKLIRAINTVDANDVGFLILKYYDDYVVEVRRHMEYENDVIFPYIRALVAGEPTDGTVSLRDYSLNHDDMVDKLQELKDIIIRHYTHANNNILTYTLYDIINVEADLMSHWEIEDKLFFPVGIRLERTRMAHPATSLQRSVAHAGEAAPGSDELSQREREIIALVAKGLSNKEIADVLCLSIHTVTTHRRNIASKLQIHSPAGLTIYAILHKIIEITDVKAQ